MVGAGRKWSAREARAEFLVYIYIYIYIYIWGLRAGALRQTPHLHGVSTTPDGLGTALGHHLDLLGHARSIPLSILCF